MSEIKFRTNPGLSEQLGPGLFSQDPSSPDNRGLTVTVLYMYF